MKQGVLISIEGIDGSGKSTLARNLHSRLKGLNIPCILTKEPGATALGSRLRTLLQTQDVPISPQAEFLLFAADRAQHMRDVIMPALNAGHVVISDRMADSSLVYQGHARGLSIEIITHVNQWVMQDIEPDITFYVEVDAATAQQRLQKRNVTPSAFEQEEHNFIQRLIEGFELLCTQISRIVRLDGSASPEQVTNQAQEVTITWIENNRLSLHPHQTSTPQRTHNSG